MGPHMRRLIAFPCAGETLVGTLDEAQGATGLLIVSGGNEIRCGAHRGMALLAARLAAAGKPVFRFDRRGIGDSSGDNRGFEESGADIQAAIHAFRDHAPGVTRLVAFGNCDAASALLLHAANDFDRLVLANPWLLEPSDDLPPAAAIRQRYAGRLRDPASWRRLATGAISLPKLFRGLSKLIRSNSQPRPALEHLILTAASAHPDLRILLAQGDATAIAFDDAARRARLELTIERVPTASHSFARPADREALFQSISAALADD